MAQAVEGQIICRAGRATKCVHKRNALIMGGAVHIQTCALGADDNLCSKAGQALAAEVI